MGKKQTNKKQKICSRIIIIALHLIYTTMLQGKNIIHLSEAPHEERSGGELW